MSPNAEPVVFSRYQYLRALGQGAFADVILARDLRTDREVALKCLRQVESSSEAAPLFLEEFERLKALRHKNIVSVFDLCSDEDSWAYSMAFVPGSSLGDGELSFSTHDYLRIADQLLSALQAIHDQSLVHGDLSPENVFVHRIEEAFPQVTIIDLGLASPAGEVGSRGTPAYMAPELFQGQGSDARCDLYGLGIVLLESITGVSAFEVDDIDLLIQQKLKGPIQGLEALQLKAEPALATFVQSLLDSNPSKRPKNVEEARAGLHAAAQALGIEGGLETNAALPPRPLVGRSHIVEQALLLAQSVRLTEEGRLLQIEGAEGSGRGRICDELACQLQLQGWNPRVCVAEAALPFALVRQLLPLALQGIGRASQVEALEGRHGIAARFLRSQGADLPVDLERADLVEALTALFVELLQGEFSAWLIRVTGPCDGGSLDVLSRVLLKLRRVPLLFVLITDSHPAEGSPGQVLSTLIEEEGISDAKLPLLPLGEDEVLKLTHRAFGNLGAIDSLCTQLHAQSSGNPWLLDRLLSQLVADGALQRQSSGWLLDAQRATSVLEALPASRVAFFKHKLAPLPPESREIAEVLGILQVAVSMAGLRALFQGDIISKGLNPLISGGLLTWDGLGIAPPGAMFKAALDGLLSDARRLAIHRSLLPLLEPGGALWDPQRSQQPPAQMRYVRHLMAGKDPRALAFGLKLAELYIAGFDFDQASRFLAELGQQHLSHDLWLAQATCYENLGDYASAAQVLTRLKDEGHGSKEDLSVEAQAAFYRRLASAFSRTGDLDSAEQSIEHSVQLLGQSGNIPARLETAHDRAMILQFRGDPKAARQHLLLSLRLVGATTLSEGDAELPVLDDGDIAKAVLANLHLLGAVSWQLGEHVQAEAWLSKGFQVLGVGAETLWTEGIKPSLVAGSEANLCLILGSVARQKGEFQQAVKLFTRAADYYEKSGRHRGAARCFNNLGIARMMMGEWAEAIRLWERFLYLCDRVADHADHATALNNLGSAYREQGRLDLAKHRLTQAASRAKAAGYLRLRGMIDGNLGELALREGNLAVARKFYLSSIEISQEAKARDDEVEGRRRLLELDVLEEEPFSIEQWQKVLTLAQDSQNRVEEGNLLGLGGMQYVLKGERDLGMKYLKEGRQILSSIGAVFEQARLEVKMARALYIAEEFLEADRLLGEAQGCFEKLGARYDMEEAQSLAQSLELDSPGVSDSRKNLQLLLEVNRDLASVLDLGKLMSLIVSHALQISQAERGFVILFDDVGRQTFKAARHMGRSEVDIASSQISSTMVHQVLSEKKAMAVTNVRDNAVLRDQKSVLSLGLRTIMAAPMLRQDRVIGIIYVDSPYVTRTFHDKDLRLMEALAEAAGVAVQNAQRYDDLKRKTEMMYFMAHEFRSPLTAVLSFSDLLLMDKDSLNGEQAEFVGIIGEQGRRLSRMVSSVLELAKMEAKQVDWVMNELSLDELIAQTVRALQPLAAEKSVLLQVEPASDVPVIFGNHDRLCQVLTNLIANACKFSGQGGQIFVRLLHTEIPSFLRSDFQAGSESWRSRAPAPGQSLSEDRCVRVIIDDEGDGIDPAALQHIFEKFGQEGGKAKRAKGTGLGLAIAKEIIEQHGGRIWAENRDEGGARFSFIIPVAERQERGPGSTPEGQ